jgi:hypothetical protein
VKDAKYRDEQMKTDQTNRPIKLDVAPGEATLYPLGG